MENDEKLTSHHEDALPGDDADAKTPPDDGAGEIPMPPFDAAEEASERSNTISFPRSVHVGAAGRIEANFGMPDFDFPEPPRGGAPYESASAYDSAAHYESAAAYESGDGDSDDESDTGSESAIEATGGEDLAARGNADMPLDEGTGWDSVGRIERPASLMRARSERAEPAYEPAPPPRAEPAFEPPPPPRAEANVMPFPGAAMHRSAEPVPSEMLRGMAESPRSEMFAGRSEEAAEPHPDFDAGGGDALADAVQSALRNVYGGQSADRGEEPIDPGSFTVAESLMHASAERAGPDGWHQERAEDFYQGEMPPAGEANTEAVLDYLYGQRRGERAQQPGLSADSSLRDFGEASGYSQDWQDGPQFDDRFAAQGALRDFGDTPYRNAQQRFADPGDRIYMRDSDAYRGEVADEAEWAQVPYLSHGGAVSSPAYIAPLPASTPDGLSSGSPDSSHLLGAAGLGLIGGIALAGVLAVFAFNSIYDEGAQKVVGRLESPAVETAPAETLRAAQPAPAAPAQREAVIQPEPAPAPAVAAPRPVPHPVIAAARLSAQNAAGVAGDSIALEINVADSADRDETLVSLKGLPAAAKLSTGIDVGGGQWLLPPARLANLTVALPRGASGDYDLEVQLLQDDAQTSLSDPVPFQLKVSDRAAQQGQGNASGGVTRSTPVSAAANADQAARLAVLPDETPQIETDFVTQMLIRDGNRLMRDGDIASARKLYEQAAATGNAEAALAMGRSYDPSYFEKLQVKSGKPDPATAFEWYKRALEGGLVTARVKIDALKQWLQR